MSPAAAGSANAALERKRLRALLPILNAAVECVAQGLASPEEVDGLVQVSAARPLGPLRLADRIGLDRCVEALHALHRATGRPEHRPSPLLVAMVGEGLVGCRAGAGFFDYPLWETEEGQQAAAGGGW